MVNTTSAERRSFQSVMMGPFGVDELVSSMRDAPPDWRKHLVHLHAAQERRNGHASEWKSEV